MQLCPKIIAPQWEADSHTLVVIPAEAEDPVFRHRLRSLQVPSLECEDCHTAGLHAAQITKFTVTLHHAPLVRTCSADVMCAPALAASHALLFRKSYACPAWICTNVTLAGHKGCGSRLRASLEAPSRIKDECLMNP